jgi:hypothetical protein
MAQAQEPAAPAQEPAAPAEQEPAEESAAEATTADGELVSVDSEKKTLKIKGSDGAEMEFSYNDETEISGATSDAAGLATEAGSQVTVTYSEEGGTKAASKIEVKAKE